MNVGAAFETNAETTELMQPGMHAFNTSMIDLPISSVPVIPMPRVSSSPRKLRPHEAFLKPFLTLMQPSSHSHVC
ncbi:hypothetical protein WS96_10100 [Burkholderia sp. MSMB1835]|nr:hypothetical protein WS96_10100 [Burkholderia sp. MSMB1835]